MFPAVEVRSAVWGRAWPQPMARPAKARTGGDRRFAPGDDRHAVRRVALFLHLASRAFAALQAPIVFAAIREGVGHGSAGSESRPDNRRRERHRTGISAPV